MRHFLLLSAFFLLNLLTACDPGPKVGPRLDFVGSSRFTTSDQVVPTPGDTLSSLIYADNRDTVRSTSNDDDYTYLSNFRAYVTYEPGPTPSTYPNGRQTNLPKREYLYVDSVLAPSTSRFVFRHDFTARTTSGRETWRFEITDAEGRIAGRQYRLTVRRNDSAAVVHTYSVLLQAPLTLTPARRSFLDVTNGLAFNGYATKSPKVQRSVDLAYVPGNNNGLGLAAPNADAAAMSKAGTSAWPMKTKTELRETTLTTNDFNGANDEAALINGFNAAGDITSYIPSLSENKVIAFRANPNTDSARTGLILVQRILPTTTPTVLLQVRVSKRPLQ
ncbi:hypothetical protein [Hymenobacter cavernae]|uniref:Uncharacterized protein n=1 Tax=Hymenobacter cavernae TaxID=2044852 RepID=A0ABQ1TV47_9BACT|nr:hypothetical protein [Hymenobacter cavernae]GGF04532.1 hypothetical protein GCM10011383_14550 [Hymenobacter cavernae]